MIRGSAAILYIEERQQQIEADEEDVVLRLNPGV